MITYTKSDMAPGTINIHIGSIEPICSSMVSFGERDLREV